MLLFHFFINFAIFTLLISIPLVIRSFASDRFSSVSSLWYGVYAGIVSIILIMLDVHEVSYTYDLRYAPVILAYSYLGPGAGLISGGFALVGRLLHSGGWPAVVFAWLLFMAAFILISRLYKRESAVKKTVMLFFAYVAIYMVTVRFFLIVHESPTFHLIYISFVLASVCLGVLLVESNMKLYRYNAKLSEMYQRAEESESKYRLIAENTSDFILVMNADETVAYASPSHEQLLKISSTELEQSQPCKYIHPEDIDRFKAMVRSMYETLEPAELEYKMQSQTGEWMDLESRGVPVKGKDGQLEHIVFISRDISQRKKAEEALLKSEKLSVVGELAAGIAHEIRNPLTTIKGFVQMRTWGENNQYRGLLLGELERIETITSELLSLGKPQAVQLSRVDIGDLLAQTITLIYPEALLNRVEFHFSRLEGAVQIDCEKNQMKQVFLNIFKNAIEAMPDGGHVYVSLAVEGGCCIIKVRDEGGGIPDELIHRLGEPFYSLKEKGTGLGLMICHNVIKKHQGTIQYQSKLDAGTVVSIELPLVRDLQKSV